MPAISLMLFLTTSLLTNYSAAQMKQLATMTTAAESNQPTRVTLNAHAIFSAIYAIIDLVSSIFCLFSILCFQLTLFFLLALDSRGWSGG